MKFLTSRKHRDGTFPVVQWFLTPSAEGLGSILGQGTRSHMLQLRPGTAKQINRNIFLKKHRENIIARKYIQYLRQVACQQVRTNQLNGLMLNLKH